jgi:hypothetical protein
VEIFGKIGTKVGQKFQQRDKSRTKYANPKHFINIGGTNNMKISKPIGQNDSKLLTYFVQQFCPYNGYWGGEVSCPYFVPRLCLGQS